MSDVKYLLEALGPTLTNTSAPTLTNTNARNAGYLKNALTNHTHVKELRARMGGIAPPIGWNVNNHHALERSVGSKIAHIVNGVPMPQAFTEDEIAFIKTTLVNEYTSEPQVRQFGPGFV